ncbi:uncharacterized protein EAF01_011425 [Botrytis porri]|uniref:BTB domain-containing protein n=1 Tax=Botrytis porri TaxID=87229 RepID=A0A4Z1KMJ1_9HELO|nr:uncharacterized protein EAF01_011425 [Botrytis porri]KAF7885360.1 hypothetical protein EAF01_011425 [Botrytis porri]TGO86700.1 hypothetical protein BPOR_0283g00090 [Botrytis porri]
MANDTSDVAYDDRVLPSIEKSIDDYTDGNQESVLAQDSSLVEPHFDPAQSQEHASDMSESVSSSSEDGDRSVSSSDEADRALEQDLETWGPPMASVQIGSHNNVLTVHAKRLREKIPYFAKIFNFRRLNFHQSYPKLNPAAFKLFKRWIYGTTIAEQERNKCRTIELFALFSIACCFEQKSLQDEAMECIVKEIGESSDESRFTPEHVIFAYEATPDGSKLRLFCAASVTEAMEEENQFKWDREEVSMLLDVLPELRVDIHPEAIHRFKNASEAANNTSSDHHQRTEVDGNIQPVHDKSGGDHLDVKPLPGSSPGSDEHKGVKHGRMELDGSAGSGGDSSGQKPGNMSVPYNSPNSNSGEGSGNKKRVRLSGDGDEAGATTLRRPDPEANDPEAIKLEAIKLEAIKLEAIDLEAINA